MDCAKVQRREGSHHQNAGGSNRLKWLKQNFLTEILKNWKQIKVFTWTKAQKNSNIQLNRRFRLPGKEIWLTIHITSNNHLLPYIFIGSNGALVKMYRRKPVFMTYFERKKGNADGDWMGLHSFSAGSVKITSLYNYLFNRLIQTNILPPKGQSILKISCLKLSKQSNVGLNWPFCLQITLGKRLNLIAIRGCRWPWPLTGNLSQSRFVVPTTDGATWAAWSITWSAASKFSLSFTSGFSPLLFQILPHFIEAASPLYGCQSKLRFSLDQSKQIPAMHKAFPRGPHSGIFSHSYVSELWGRSQATCHW